jgi:hypothetical protein
MVGDWIKCCPWDLAQNHKLSSRRCVQRRTVDASGDRDGFLQCGAACSAVLPPTIRSQACCRQGTVKCPEGANQLGKTVKVFLHGRQIPRRTQMRSCWSSWAWRSRRPWNDRVVLAQRAQPRQEMQRHYPGSMLSLVSGSAIKRITAGVKARR